MELAEKLFNICIEAVDRNGEVDPGRKVEVIAALQAQVAARVLKVEELEAKYSELIMAVGNKYADENRHATALRYIRSAEQRGCSPACVATKQDAGPIAGGEE